MHGMVSLLTPCCCVFLLSVRSYRFDSLLSLYILEYSSSLFCFIGCIVKEVSCLLIIDP
jgi:hypothetical protein